MYHSTTTGSGSSEKGDSGSTLDNSFECNDSNTQSKCNGTKNEWNKLNRTPTRNKPSFELKTEVNLVSEDTQQAPDVDSESPLHQSSSAETCPSNSPSTPRSAFFSQFNANGQIFMADGVVIHQMHVHKYGQAGASAVGNNQSQPRHPESSQDVRPEQSCRCQGHGVNADGTICATCARPSTEGMQCSDGTQLKQDGLIPGRQIDEDAPCTQVEESLHINHHPQPESSDCDESQNFNEKPNSSILANDLHLPLSMVESRRRNDNNEKGYQP